MFSQRVTSMTRDLPYDLIRSDPIAFLARQVSQVLYNDPSGCISIGNLFGPCPTFDKPQTSCAESKPGHILHDLSKVHQRYKSAYEPNRLV